jgi:hypothetical protein
MKTKLIHAGLLTAMLALPLASLAQYTQQPGSEARSAPGTAAPGTPAASPQYGQGGSKHCDAMTGAEKDQCLKDEAAKTDTKGSADSAATGPSASPSTAGSGGDAIHAPAPDDKTTK